MSQQDYTEVSRIGEQVGELVPFLSSLSVTLRQTIKIQTMILPTFVPECLDIAQVLMQHVKPSPQGVI